MKISLSFLMIIAGFVTWAGVPQFDGTFALNSRDYTLVISGKEKMCITKIIYKDYLLGANTGFYGSILAPEKAQFIGSGHNEGGEEKVISIELSVDGEQQEVSQDTKFNGTIIKLKKTSILDNLKVYVEYTVTHDGIRIDKNFEALENQKAYSFYIFQFCWTNKSKDWMIGRPDGSTDTGIFKSDMGWHLLKERELYWCALFAPEAQKGILSYFASYYPGQGKYMLWDKNVYHKFYYWANLPNVITKGTKSRQYTMILRGINATPEKWKKTIHKMVSALEAEYPLPKTPDKFHFGFENSSGDNAFKGKKCLHLQGNGSFKCEKVPISLQKNSTYRISLAIRKTPDCSPKGSDSFIMIGQRDKNGVLHVIKTCAGNIPKDNEWHQVISEFKTSENVSDSNIYIYNKNSRGSVWVDELNIQKMEN